MLQSIWVALFVIACAAPVVLSQRVPDLVVPAVALAVVVGLGVVGSAWAWRRGAEGMALAPVAGAVSCSVLIIYGAIARPVVSNQSHRPLAATINQIVPDDESTVMFFHELDEGLWFYLRNRHLAPVPGSQPETNDAHDLLMEARRGELVQNPQLRIRRDLDILLGWIADPERSTSYMLIRDRVYDHFSPALKGKVTELYREPDLQRNELILLRVDPVNELASNSAEHRDSRRGEPSPRR
jgi:hypothetical protein